MLYALHDLNTIMANDLCEKCSIIDFDAVLEEDKLNATRSVSWSAKDTYIGRATYALHDQ